MGTQLSAFDRLIAEGMRFHCDMAMYRNVPKDYSTGWRIMPFSVIAGLTQGSALVEIADRPTWTLRPGIGICVVAGTNHCFSHAVESFAASVHVEYRILGNIDLLSLVELPMPLPRVCYDRLVASNRRLAEVTLRTRGQLIDICAYQACGFALLETLIEVGRITPQSIDRLRTAQRLEPVLAAIDQDLMHIDLVRLTRCSGISSSRLSVLFHEAFSCSPMEYVRRQRLQRARVLLAASDQPIHAIAELSGYPDQFHFSRLFKRVHGLSPSQYRSTLSDRLL